MANKAEFAAAWNIAKSATDLSHVDDLILFGCGLPDFERVTVTIETLAKFLRWQCCQLNGGVDEEELNEMAKIARHKILIAG